VQIRVPAALAQATAEKDPSVGVLEPDLDAAVAARFAFVRGDVDNGMLLDGRAESRVHSGVLFWGALSMRRAHEAG
jgi:hypothetical protein